MSCNCMTNQQLGELYKRYGYKVKVSKKASLWFKIKNNIFNVIISLLMLIIFPLLFIYVSYVTVFGDGKISLKKFFNLKEINIEDYVRKQQELQDKNKNKSERGNR